MHIRQNVLKFSFLLLCANFLQASDACHIIDVNFNGKWRKVDCKAPLVSVSDILASLGCSQAEEPTVKMSNGQCIPITMACKVRVAQCNRLSITTKKS